MKKWITVVIPVYNRVMELERCLKSLANQSIKTFRVIVCDDGSNYEYEIVNLINSYQKLLDISLIKIKNSGGPAVPRNTSISNVSTEWVALLDSDDWWCRSKLETIKTYIDKYDFIYHKMNINDRSLNILNANIGRAYPDENIAFHIMVSGNHIPTSSVVVKTKLIEGLGFDENRKIISYEDVDLWVRLFSKYRLKVKFINKALGVYSKSQDSISQVSTKQIKSYLFFYIKNKNILSKKYYKYQISYFYYTMGSLYFSLNKFLLAKKYFLRVKNLYNINNKIKKLIKLLYCYYKK